MALAISQITTSDPVTRPAGPLVTSVPLLRIRSTAIDRHVHQRCPTARNIGDGRCRSRPSITVLAHPSNLVLTHRRLTIVRTFASSTRKAVGARRYRRSTDTSAQSDRTTGSVYSASWTSSGTSRNRARGSCPSAANSRRPPFRWLRANPTVWGAAAGAMRAPLMESMQRASSWRRTSRQPGSRVPVAARHA